MNTREKYEPGPAAGALVKKDGELWTLVLVRELQHAPEKVWEALTDPVQLREWAPFDANDSLATVGKTVKITWVGAPAAMDIKVTRADAPKLLEYTCDNNNTRWELEPVRGGTRLTLYASIDRRYISMGAAGWHIALDVLERQLGGNPISRVAGGDAMKFAGWQRLNAEYAKQFGVEAPSW